MAGKIFYRERRKVEEKDKKPRFKIMAHTGTELKFLAEHFKKKELEEIAAAVGAELILVESGHAK